METNDNDMILLTCWRFSCVYVRACVLHRFKMIITKYTISHSNIALGPIPADTYPRSAHCGRYAAKSTGYAAVVRLTAVTVQRADIYWTW